MKKEDKVQFWLLASIGFFLALSGLLRASILPPHAWQYQEILMLLFGFCTLTVAMIFGNMKAIEDLYEKLEKIKGE